MSGKIFYVHRLMYESVYGEIPPGMQVDHKCWTRNCVNPKHLRLATPAENNFNRKGASKNSKTGIRGVSWSNSNKKYIAQIAQKGKRYYLGSFSSIELAEAAVENFKAGVR